MNCAGKAGHRIFFPMVSILNLIAGIVFSSVVFCHAASEQDWYEGTYADANGATRDYYNREAGLPWRKYMGDWVDANNVSQGNNAYASTTLIDDNTSKWIEWDVTTLVVKWVSGTYENKGMLIRSISGGGTHKFRSREYPDPFERPELVINTSRGIYTLTPEADTYNATSTYRGFGDAEDLVVSGSNNILMRFNLNDIPPDVVVLQARLRLHDFAQYGQMSACGIFRCDQGHDPPDFPPVKGLAANYDEDNGIENDPEVIFFTGFESSSWQDEWSAVGHPENGIALDVDEANLFVPFQGKAVRSRIPDGSTSGMSLTYRFRSEIGNEPEEIYFRYYLRFGNSWNPTIDGGKLPGIAGTYGVAGWGGRKSDGTNGWSARGHFRRQLRPGNPLGDKDNPIGYYCYHADMPGTYGDVWLWFDGYRGYLENNRWYAVEQYAKMNTPREKDGILRGWVDGNLAFEKTDIRFRHVDALKIETIWMNVYHGGTSPVAEDIDLYFDNVVIARKYIGPANSEGIHPFVDGDVNGNGKINILDVQACLNHISGTQNWGGAADVNGDGKVDLLDVQEIIEVILHE
jgi:hypothetical protein